MKRFLCLLCITLLVASTAQASSVFQIGGERLITTQNPDGGWNWQLGTTSDYNGLAQSGAGLLAAYQKTGNFKSEILNAANSLSTKSKFSVLDGYFAAKVDAAFATNYAATNGLGAYYTQTDISGNLVLLDAITGSALPNGLKLWNLGMGLGSIVALGLDQAIADTWADKIFDYANTVVDFANDNQSFLGLAGAAWGIATAGADTTGFADWIALYQNTDGGFGFDPDQSSAQETAWAILALKALGYDTNIIANGEAYLLSEQLSTNGWGNPAGQEYNTVTGDVLSALGATAPVPEPATIGLLGLGLAGLGWLRRRA